MVNETKVLTVSNLQIAYEGDQIISDFSFAVEKREILRILWPNRAGKTTFIRALQNFLPYQGTVLWEKWALRPRNSEFLKARIRNSGLGSLLLVAPDIPRLNTCAFHQS